VATVLCVGGRIEVRCSLGAARLSGRNSRRVLLLGDIDCARSIAARIDANRVLGYRIVGLVVAERSALESETPGLPIVGHVDDLQAILEKHPVDEMILCLGLDEYAEAIGAAIHLSDDLGLCVRLFPV